MGNAPTVDTASFNAKSTAEQVGKVYGTHAKDKFVVITGANCGLGLETARVLAKHGANITIACRNLKAAEEAMKTIKQESPDANIEVRALDLSNLQSVRSFAEGYRASGRPLHILINNAGIMACPKAFTADGLESQIGVNHMGHFVLTNELLTVLKKSGTPQNKARVVNLASIANILYAPSMGIRLDDLRGEQTYSQWERYGSSKLANILFSRELNRRLVAEDAPVMSVSLHPGVITETNLMRHVNNLSGISAAISSLNGWSAFSNMAAEPSKNIAQGAATTVLCALSPDVVAGQYYADCAVSTLLHQKATDDDLAKQLWGVSEQVTVTKY